MVYFNIIVSVLPVTFDPHSTTYIRVAVTSCYMAKNRKTVRSNVQEFVKVRNLKMWDFPLAPTDIMGQPGMLHNLSIGGAVEHDHIWDP